MLDLKSAGKGYRFFLLGLCIYT